MKRAILFAMTGLCILGWCVTGKSLVEKPMEYRKLIHQAEEYESQKIYVRAIETYKSALEYLPGSIDLQLRIAQDYLELGDEVSFINRCNTINQKSGYPVKAVVCLADYYIANKRYEPAIKVLQTAMKKHSGNTELQERFDKLKYTYEKLYIAFDEILPFRNDSAVVKSEEQFGVINPSGKNLIRANKEWTGVLSSDREMIPMCQDGEYFYADDSGYRVETPKDGQKIESLGILYQDIAPAKINGKYGYINSKFEELSPFIWENASVIDHFGSVFDGNKWALISDSFQNITDYIYDDVKMDCYGYCSIAERVFVKFADGYHMVDGKGNPVGSEVFEDAYPFLSEEPAAVKINEKWGFVDHDGTLVIDPKFESAESFNGGLAPVETENGWGFIDTAGTMVIADEFYGAHSFYKGVAPVKAGTQWSLISLNVHE